MTLFLDDDLAAPATHAHFAERHRDRLLMIVPACSRGLGEEHFCRIRAFTHPRPRAAPAPTRLLARRKKGVRKKDAGKKKRAGRKAGGMSDAGRKAGGARTSNPEPSGDILAPEGIGSQAHRKD